MQAKLPPIVEQILKKMADAGFKIYVVGGAVRDLLLEKPIKDWDFTTKATPEQILKVFPDAFYNNKFGTVAIVDENQEVYEITTFRQEVGYSDKRHPDKVVWGKTLEEDLARRDFTINAMALSLEHNLIDPFYGQEDLKKKLIRAVRNPQERFNEDALRMIRAVRFAAQLGFTIDSETFNAIKNLSPLINQIAKERVKDEFFKILSTDSPYEGIMFLFSTGLLELLIPELAQTYGVAQARHHIYDVWTHSLLSLKHCPSKDPLVRFATLIHDIGKPKVAKGEGQSRTFYNHEMASATIAEELADRFRLSKKEKNKLVTFVRWHQFTVDERQTDSALRRFIRNVGKENLQDMLDLRVGDRLGGGARETSWRLEKFKKRLVEVQKQPFSVNDLKVDGHDVMKILKIKPGPKVGQVLSKLFDEVVEKKIKNEHASLVKRILELGKK